MNTSRRRHYFGFACILAAVVGGAGAARAADDTVTVNGITLYGTIDMGVAYQNHGTPLNDYFYPGLEYLVSKNSNHAIFSAAPNGMSQSKIGVKGFEQLFGDWSGLFKLETGFMPTSGQLADAPHSQVQNNGVPLGSQTSNADGGRAGQAFNGEIYAGVSNTQFGTLTLGRHNAILTDNISRYDPQGGSYAFSPLGYSGTVGGGAGDTEDTRLDHSVKYFERFGPIHGGALYQFGGGSSSNGSGYQFNLGGDYLGASVDAVYVHKKDAISTGALSSAQVAALPGLGFSANNSLSGTISDNTAYAVMGMYDFGKPKIYAGYQHVEYANPSSGLSAGTNTIGGYTLAFVNNSAYNKRKDLDIVWTGVKYFVTPSFSLTGAYYHYEQNSYAATGANVGCSDARAATCSGATDAASLVADYRFSKRFDVYAGAMWSGANNGMANGYLNTASIDPMIGARFNF